MYNTTLSSPSRPRKPRRTDAVRPAGLHAGSRRHHPAACGRDHVFFFSSRRRHTRCLSDWSSDVCSSDLITARDPELTDHFWVNPFGLHFSRIKVSDLLLVNSQGEIAIGDAPLNRAAFAIHAALHEARPEIIAAAHTHSIYGKAWSTLGRKLDPLTQDSCAFYQDHGLFEDFGGVVYETSEGDQIAEALGPRKGVILKNHGILTAGPSVEAAAWWYIALDNACQVQLLAEAAGSPHPIPHEQAALTHG